MVLISPLMSLSVLDDLDFDLFVTRTRSPMCKVIMSTFSSTVLHVVCLLTRTLAAGSGDGIATAVTMLIGCATGILLVVSVPPRAGTCLVVDVLPRAETGLSLQFPATLQPALFL